MLCVILSDFWFLCQIFGKLLTCELTPMQVNGVGVVFLQESDQTLKRRQSRGNEISCTPDKESRGFSLG